MKYKIRRTSTWDSCPHPDAVREEYILIDRRTVATLEEAKKQHWYKNWYEGGVNHRVERGMIACDVKYRNAKDKVFYRWVIEIDDLVKWVEDLGSEIILKPKYNDASTNPLPEIEIYDDYRE